MLLMCVKKKDQAGETGGSRQPWASTQECFKHFGGLL